MSGVLDYSKWENLSCSSSSGEEKDWQNDESQFNEIELQPRKPKVTKLDKPSTVTFGGGEKAKPDTNQAQPSGQDACCEGEELGSSESLASEKKVKELPSRESLVEKWTQDGTENKEPLYYWSQTKDTITMRIPVPIGTKAKDLKITASNKELIASITTASKNKEGEGKENNEWSDLVRGNFDREIKDHDWEVLDAEENCRHVVLTLAKNPMEGTIYWAPCVIAGHERIDVTKIKGRKNTSNIQNLWKEANEGFKERIKRFQKTDVVCDPDEQN